MDRPSALCAFLLLLGNLHAQQPAPADLNAWWANTPRLHLGILFSEGRIARPNLAGTAFIATSAKPLQGIRMDAAWRTGKQGLCLGLEFASFSQQAGDFMRDSTWTHSEQNWFTRYDRGELLGMEQQLTTLAPTVSIYLVPFKRKSDVGMTLRMGGALLVYQAREDYRALVDHVHKRSRYTGGGGYGGSFSFNFPSLFSSNEARRNADPEDELDVLESNWAAMEPMGSATAFGLGIGFRMRAELFFGRHFSLILPEMQLDIPLIKPAFDAVHVEGGFGPDRTIGAHTMNTSLLRLTVGAALHF